mgnify:CR=1 FL=1
MFIVIERKYVLLIDSIGDLQERLEHFGPVRLEWPNMDHISIQRNSANSTRNSCFKLVGHFSMN